MRNIQNRRVPLQPSPDRQLIGPVSKPHMEARYRAVIARDGTKCHLCGEATAPTERSLDHIEPKARGGSDRLVNLALAHKSCNSLRRTAPVDIARPIVKWYRAGWLTQAEASELLWRERNTTSLRARLAVAEEIREDDNGEYYHLVTLWKATRQERELYDERS